MDGRKEGRNERHTLIVKFLKMMNLVLVLVVSVMAWTQLNQTSQVLVSILSPFKSPSNPLLLEKPPPPLSLPPKKKIPPKKEKSKTHPEIRQPLPRPPPLNPLLQIHHPISVRIKGAQHPARDLLFLFRTDPPRRLVF